MLGHCSMAQANRNTQQAYDDMRCMLGIYDGNCTCGLVEAKIAQLEKNSAAINGPITNPLSPNTANPPRVETNTR